MKILFPTDFSEKSLKALDWALLFARRGKAKLHIIHAYHFLASDRPSQLDEHSFDAEFERIIQIAKTKPGEGELPEINTQAVEDFATDAILRISEETNCDLIVMGTQGKGYLEEMLIGSVTTDIVMKSKVPVLVIPDNAAFSVPEEMIFAAGIREDNIDAIRILSRFSDLFGASLQVVHVQTPGEKFVQADLDRFEEKLRSAIPAGKMRFYILNAPSVEEGLVDFMKNRSTSVLAMLHRKRNFLSGLFEKSHSKQMAAHSHIPMIVFHEKESK